MDDAPSLSSIDENWIRQSPDMALIIGTWVCAVAISGPDLRSSEQEVKPRNQRSALTLAGKVHSAHFLKKWLQYDKRLVKIK